MGGETFARTARLRPSLGLVRQVLAAARAGDAQAREAVDDAVDWIALAIGNIACLIDPEAIVLGGSVAHATPSLVAAIECRLEGKIPAKPKVCFSQLGELAGVVGAVALAAQSTNGYLALMEE